MEKFKYSKLVAALFCSIFALTITSCDDDDDAPVDVLKCTPEQVEVAPGATATVTVSGGTEPYTVASGDSEIVTAKIDKNVITLTGVSEGTTNIVVTDNNNLKATVSVSVKDAEPELDFDKSEVAMAAGAEESVTVSGGTAPYTAVSGDEEIATVEVSDGVITIKGVKAGTTTVTVTDSKEKSGSISVTVE